jgi:CDP-diacylglycerol--inositol 3-phosphatidyltransferase
MHMYATLSMGGSEQSHKNVDESRSWILKQYYSNNVCGSLSSLAAFDC